MISIECLKGLPLEYESFLINRYESYFTTCRYLEIYHPDAEINSALIYENGSLIELLLFENKGDTTSCLNLLARIDQDIYSEFTKHIFEIFPAIKKVEIILSYNRYTFKKSILLHRNNDYVIKLPSKIDDYFSGLGHSTRKEIKNHKSKLLRDHHQVNFITKCGVEIEERVIEKIIQLNIARMKHKGIIPGKKNSDKVNIHKYSQYYGVVAYIEIDGEIVAGNIAYILNKRMFGYVVAHDEGFSKYNIGKICQLYLIQIAIEKGLSAYHFLWGDNDYKQRFLGKPHIMVSYFIYRAYSFNFLVIKVRTTLSRALLTVRQSEQLKPIRSVIKSYRKKKMAASLTKMNLLLN